jgi:Core-2/I-Branching enzyme
MRIAYIISAYKCSAQLERLIRRLRGDGVSFFVHIDRRSPIRDEILPRVRDVPDLHFLEQHRCVWGGFGHVAATVKGIRAISQGEVPCDYVVLLTGQDYPIKPTRTIREVLTRAEGRSFMEHFPLPSTTWAGGGLDRVLRWHVRWSRRHWVFPRRVDSPFARKFPTGFWPFGGSSYWCFSREVVEYLYSFLTRHPRFTRFFRYVDIPDEIIFQTILMNSPLRDTIVNDDLRHIEWRDLRSGSPTILTTADFPDLVVSGKLFARKFDLTVDAKILDMIDEGILGVSGG